MFAIINEYEFPPKLYHNIVVNFDSLYGTYTVSTKPFLCFSSFLLFSVNALITYLNVKRDLLISIASFNYYGSRFSP